MKVKAITQVTTSLLLASSLVACGGSGSGGDQPQPQPDIPVDAIVIDISDMSLSSGQTSDVNEVAVEPYSGYQYVLGAQNELPVTLTTAGKKGDCPAGNNGLVFIDANNPSRQSTPGGSLDLTATVGGSPAKFKVEVQDGAEGCAYRVGIKVSNTQLYRGISVIDFIRIGDAVYNIKHYEYSQYRAGDPNFQFIIQLPERAKNADNDYQEVIAVGKGKHCQQTPGFECMVLDGISDTYLQNTYFIRVPKNYEQIDDLAFIGSNIIGLDFKDMSESNLKYIGNFAFENNELTKAYLPESVEYIGQEAFTHNKIEGTNIPRDLIEIGDSAYYENYWLDSVDFEEALSSNKLKKIGAHAFSLSPLGHIVTLKLPDSVEEVGDEAFDGCKGRNIEGQPQGTCGDNEHYFGGKDNSLKVAIMPSSLKKVGRDPFGNRAVLEKVYYTSTTVPEGFPLAVRNLDYLVYVPSSAYSSYKDSVITFENCENPSPEDPSEIQRCNELDNYLNNHLKAGSPISFEH